MSKAFDTAVQAMRARQPTSSDYLNAKPKAKAPSTAYGIFTEDGLDGTCYGLREAKREAKDLKEMGLEQVTIVEVTGAKHEEALDWMHEAVRYGLNRKVTKGLITKAEKAFPEVTFKLGVH